MGFQDRAYETQLAKSAWLLELADHWSERDPDFAEELRMKARRPQSAENARRKDTATRVNRPRHMVKGGMSAVDRFPSLEVAQRRLAAIKLELTAQFENVLSIEALLSDHYRELRKRKLRLVSRRTPRAAVSAIKSNLTRSKGAG